MDIHDFNLLWFTLILVSLMANLWEEILRYVTCHFVVSIEKMSFFFSFSAIPPGTLGTTSSLHDGYYQDT